MITMGHHRPPLLPKANKIIAGFIKYLRNKAFIGKTLQENIAPKTMRFRMA